MSTNDPHVKIDYTEPAMPNPSPYIAHDDPIRPQNIPWFFKTVTVAPSAAPKGWWDQIQIVYGVGVDLYIWSDTQAQWYHLTF